MTTLLADVMRGGVVESTHAGTIAVVDGTGKLVASAGDPETFAYFRSSAKPFQAVPVIESGAADRFGFTPAELALCCASHSAEASHQAQVLAMLAKLGLNDGALQCGIPLPIDEHETALILSGQKAASPLQCDCSGKHTGMLASCLAAGYSIENYLEPEHPLQKRILGIVAEMTGVDAAAIRLATDGCSVPTFGMPIRAMARSFAVMAKPEASTSGSEHAIALNRLRAAMTAHPENVGGSHDRQDTDAMKASNGRIAAKTGAEGLLCVGLAEHGLGIAIRIADGSYRAHGVVLVAVLEQLNLLDAATREAIAATTGSRLINHNKRHVGDIKAAFTLVS